MADGVDSLNVATAAAVALHHLARLSAPPARYKKGPSSADAATPGRRAGRRR